MQEQHLGSQEQQPCMCWSSLHGLQVPVFAGQRSKVRGQSDVTTLLLTKVTGGSLQSQRGGQGALLVGAGASLTQTAPLAGIHGSTATFHSKENLPQLR